MPMAETRTKQASRRCSLCRKPEEKVMKLIAGPEANICNECIDLCNEIIEEELAIRRAR